MKYKKISYYDKKNWIFIVVLLSWILCSLVSLAAYLMKEGWAVLIDGSVSEEHIWKLSVFVTHTILTCKNDLTQQVELAAWDHCYHQ